MTGAARLLGHRGAAQWGGVRNRGGGDLGPAAEARQQLLIELVGRRALVPMDTDIHLAGDHPLGAEAGIDVERMLKRSDEETGRRQQNDGRRDLRDDECAAEPRSSLAGLNAARLERAREIDRRRVKTRHDARNERRAENDNADNREDGPIHAECDRHWNAERPIEIQKTRQPHRHECSDDAARGAQDQAFDDELPHETGAAGADRHARRHLTRASGRAREEHARGVRRGDHEHQERDAEEHRDKLLHRVLHHRWERPHRLGPRIEDFRFRILGRHTGRDDLQRFTRTSHGDTGVQTPKDVHPVAHLSIAGLVAGELPVANGRLRIRRSRDPHVDREDGAYRSLESVGRHRDDRHWAAVEVNRLSDDARVCVERTPPEVVAEYRDRLSTAGPIEL
jgi:hypothetical protein